MIPEPVGSRVSLWGESPVWHENRLYHTDIAGQAIVAWDPATGEERTWQVGRRAGFVVPRRDGGLLWGGDHGLYLLDTESGASVKLVDPEADNPDNRFNDGKCAPDGRLFAGTISLTRKTGTARLYRLDTDFSLHAAYGPVTTSNGLAWSADGKTCYYIDTPSREVKILAYDQETGILQSTGRAFPTTPLADASPDGMAIDNEGMLWIAFCHGGRVIRVDPQSGRALACIEVPAIETTSVCFGGPGGRDLYITTGVNPKGNEPLGGRLFVVRGLPVGGAPAVPFAG